MTPSALLDFLRRELAPTPGRGSATVRLTLACLAATLPILTHRIPLALLVMIVMYLITQEDTAATLLGSILAVIGVTIGLSLALLAWDIALEIVWLRLCFLAVFLFGGLFLKRVLTIGALGSAIGLPAALVMIIPDIFPPEPEILVEFVLWIWWCVTLGLLVNAAVQFLLSPGDPLLLLQHELDARLHAVAQSLRLLTDSDEPEPEGASLSSLVTAGMSRPLALLKTAALVHSWARVRHEELAALITLVDRLVTAATALQALDSGTAAGTQHERLLTVAAGCERLRQAFGDMRLPLPGEWVTLAAEQTAGAMSPLTDMERTLDEIALAIPGRFSEADASSAVSAEKRSLFLPDAFDNPEYIRFSVKGTLSALICYVFFIGFDYPGIYTSVITCFVVSLSTIGASNQKGLLRFGGAAVGGGMGLVALVYLFPNVETIGGFWLIFGAGTAVAAWVNFGTPRISYGGYQIGLAFYKAILQGFGPALSATVVRDRLIGVFFGLVVFGIVEQVLWPVRSQDALRVRLVEMLRLLADLARSGTSAKPLAVITDDIDSWRQRISQKVEDVQGLIESSKFELGSLDLDALQQYTGDAQLIFILLLSLARERLDPTRLPEFVQTSAVNLDTAVVGALEAMAIQVTGSSRMAGSDLSGALNAFEYSIVGMAAVDEWTAAPIARRLVLYRPLIAAIERLSLESLHTEQDGHRSLPSHREMFLESRETRAN